MNSVIFVLRNRVCNHVFSSEQRLQGKLPKLWERQDQPLRSSNQMTVVVLNDIILTRFKRDLLLFGPKPPIRDKLKNFQFLAHVDNLIRNLRENNAPDEKLFEIEAAAKWYSKTSEEHL